ncbi:MAG: hypothetical protein WKG32_03915 [Gemmatimonadaceae bacterium]
MSAFFLAGVALGLMGGTAADSTPATCWAGDAPTLTVRVDSARREVGVTMGPFRIPARPPEAHASMHHSAADGTPLFCFAWPVQGWARGFRLAVQNADGTPLPRAILHHLTAVNFDRRELAYPIVERLIGAGRETDDVSLPKSMGVPLTPGQRLGIYAEWHNDRGRDIEAAYIKLTMAWTPVSSRSRPTAVLPLFLDVNAENIFGAYSIPAGRSEKSYEFTLPVGGRLLQAGGHMHDYGVGVRLEDAATGRVLARVHAKRDAAGYIQGVSRQRFILWPKRLAAGHRYRLVGEYDNPTGRPLADAAMSHMVAVFTPDNLARWPALDPANPALHRDMAKLAEHNRRPSRTPCPPTQGGMTHDGTMHDGKAHNGMAHDSTTRVGDRSGSAPAAAASGCR